MATAAASAPQEIRTVLNGLKSSVDDFITNEMKNINGPTCPVIEEASRVAIAIDNASSIWQYDGFATKSEGEATPLMRYQLKNLRKMVAVLQSKDTERMKKIKSRVDFLLQSFELPAWRPKLTSVTPPYVTNYDQISFFGAFQSAAANANDRSLTERYHTFTFVSATPDKLTYSIGHVGTSHEKCEFIRVMLVARYRSPWYQGYSSVYNVWIGVKPFALSAK